MRCEEVDDPKIEDSRDAIIKVTACAICGSDLHIYDGVISSMEHGDILGHEPMGDKGSKTLTMSEFYKFDDGHSDPLNWSILKKSDTEYEGFEPSIDGSAKGEQRGNAFHWQYARDVPNKDGATTTFGFDDWFWLVEPRVLCVSASITKLGIEVARLSAFYKELSPKDSKGDGGEAID